MERDKIEELVSKLQEILELEVPIDFNKFDNNLSDLTIKYNCKDLDIINADDRYLNQYKYHAGKNITNSLISKPVILMLNHYLKCGGNNFKYKLFIHGNDRQYTLDINNLKEIR